MGNVICCIPVDTNGNKLWVKDFKQTEKKAYVKYKSTLNDIPFRETEISVVDGGQNAIITGDDGTVLYRFSVNWIAQLLDESMLNPNN